jgi:hypothetical protein
MQGTGVAVIRENVLMKTIATANVEDVENCILNLIFVHKEFEISDELQIALKTGEQSVCSCVWDGMSLFVSGLCQGIAEAGSICFKTRLHRRIRSLQILP